MDLTQEYMKKFAAPTAIKSESTIRQGIQPKLIIGYNATDNRSRLFIENLDKVLQRLSGFDRVQITGLDAMKNAAIIKSMGVPVPGLILMRGKESLSFSGNTENAISNFFTKNQKLWR